MPKFDRWGRMKYDPEIHVNQGKYWTTREIKYLIDYYYKVGPSQQEGLSMSDYIRNMIELKITPQYFKDQQSGVKSFEIRYNDRHYMVGQTLVLKEWDGHKFTGRQLTRKIIYITDYMQMPGYVVLGTKPVNA